MTILFADLAGSTSMQDRLDAEATARVMERIHAVLAAAVTDEGGRVVKSTGDGIMAVFGVPVLREDDALRAVRAGLAMQSSFGALSEKLVQQTGSAVGLRVGVNTGEVVVSPDDDDVVGDPVNVAARLESAAGVGEVLIGPETRRATRDRLVLDAGEPLQLKGKQEPVPAARVVAVKESAGADTPFLGRETDLAELLGAFDAAVSSRAARLATILGFAGLGKSRLAAEFTTGLAERARVVEARFVRDGASSFGPIADGLRRSIDVGSLDLGEDRDRAVATVDALVSGSSPGSTEQVFWAIRRVLEASAANEPVIVVLDDLHWAEPAMLDLVEHLAEWLRAAPVLLLALARPELRDVRPSLVEVGGPSHAVVVLGGLDVDVCRHLVLDVLETDTAPEAVLRRVLDAGEGNPLFLRELVRLLVDDGVLQRDERGWRHTVDVESIELPSTIHAAIAARIEQLDADEREVLEVASVIGRHFARGAVAALLTPPVAARLDGVLAALHRRALVDPEGTWWEDERLYRFHHVLIRDAAYRRVLKEVRADNHVRYADWLAARAGDSIGEHDETLGHHLEQAVVYRRELGHQVDDELVARGMRHFSAAGRRALDADDLANAASLLGRAVGLGAGDADLLRDHCEAVVSGGDVAAAEEAVAALDAAARDDRERALADVYGAQLAAQRTPDAVRDVAVRAAAAADTLAAHGDDAGVAKAESVHAGALLGLGQVGDAETALDRALAAARRAGDRRRANDVLSLAPRAALWGPSPITRASGRCLDVIRVLRITSWAPHVEAQALRCQAVLEAMRDRPDAARRMLDSARETFTDLGHRVGLLDTAIFAGLVELLADDPAAAERHLREAVAGYEALGARVGVARATALLARALLDLDRLDEAEAMADPGLAGDDLKSSIGLLGVRAEVLGRRGDAVEAERLARAAVALAEPTDASVDHADARLSLARVLAAGGRVVDADAELSRARALYESKGASVGVRRCGPVVAAGEPAPPRTASRRRVRPNLATAAGEAIARDIAAGDDAALSRHSTTVEVRLHHLDIEVGTDEHFENLRRAVEACAVITPEFLATLGDRHALVARRIARSDDEDVGDVERHVVVRTDGNGLVTRNDVFADDGGLAPALACLVQRWAEDELTGAARRRAEVLASCVVVATAGIDERNWTRYADIYEPHCVLVDHRSTETEIRGRDTIVDFVRTLVETANPIAGSITDILAVSGDAMLWRWETSGEIDGGSLPLPALLALRVGTSGRFDRLEFFSPEEADAAWSCVERMELGRRRRVAPNLVTEISDTWDRAVSERDADGLATLYTPDFEFVDHTVHAGEGATFHVDRLVSDLMRERVEVVNEMLASLGERHGLWRATVIVRDADGETLTQFERLQVGRASAAGRLQRIDAFTADALDRAVACLVRRWAEDERPATDQPRAEAMAAAWQVDEATRARDWDAYLACFDDEIVLVDHPTGFEVHGAASAADWLRELIASAERFETNLVDVLAITSRAALWVRETTGAWAAGGTFEMPSLNAVRFGASGRIDRLEFFSPTDAGLAWACFERFDGSRRRPVTPNPAAGAFRQWIEGVQRGDADAWSAGRAVDWSMIDHTTGAELDLDQQAAREGDMHGATVSEELLATIGHRLALHRLRVERGDAASFEFLLVNHAGREGSIESSELFDGDRLDDALACLVRQQAEPGFSAGTAATIWNLNLAVNERDWDRLGAVLPSEVVFVDHRPTSAGEVNGRDAVISWYQGIVALTDRLVIRTIDVLAVTPSALLVETMAKGEAAGGPVEIRSLVAARGDGTRLEIFPPEKIDDAWRCFDALTPDRPQPPVPADHGGPGKMERVFTENAASMLVQQWAVAFNQRQLDLANSLRARDYERRDHLWHHVVDHETAQSLDAVTIVDGRADIETLVTVADRHALSHLRFVVGDAISERFVVTSATTDLAQLESDDLYGPRQLDEAIVALQERRAAELWPGGPPASAMRWAGAARAFRMAVQGEWDEYRALLHDDVVLRDHRLTGIGEVRGVEPAMEVFRSACEAVADHDIAVTDVLLVTDDRVVVEIEQTGAAGGVTFEERMLIDCRRAPDGTNASIDMWPPASRTSLLAEIAARPRRIEPNLATEAVDRWATAAATRDTAATSELYAPGHGITRHDQHLAVDRDTYLRRERQLVENGSFRVEVLASLGRRHALHRDEVQWDEDGDGSLMSMAILGVSRVDEQGRFLHDDVLPDDQLHRALALLVERWAEDELDEVHRARAMQVARQLRFPDLVAARDWDGYRSLLTEESVQVDHRPTSAGEMHGADAVVAWIRELDTVAGRVTVTYQDVLALTPTAVLWRNLASAETPSGTVHWPSLVAARWDAQGLLERSELFPLDDADGAWSCFERFAATGAVKAVRP